MTKKLEEVFNLPQEEVVEPQAEDHVAEQPVINLQEKLEEFDKISAALPRVKGLGDISDAELDNLAAKAEQAYNDLTRLCIHSTCWFISKNDAWFIYKCSCNCNTLLLSARNLIRF